MSDDRATDLIVRKYGGSSLETLSHIFDAAHQVAALRSRFWHVAVVVSAMGQTTDHLLEMAHQCSPTPNTREQDLLLATGELRSAALFTLALQELGVPARALSGPQAGIRACACDHRVHIEAIDPVGVLQAFSDGEVAVVAGFQGVNAAGDLATLGRGGSDLTAVALAAVLGASLCELCTDVDGVFDRDPRLHADATMLRMLTYEDMIELSSGGAQVVQREAVALAREHRIALHVRSSFSNAPGTLITHSSAELRSSPL